MANLMEIVYSFVTSLQDSTLAYFFLFVFVFFFRIIIRMSMCHIAPQPIINLLTGNELTHHWKVLLQYVKRVNLSRNFKEYTRITLKININIICFLLLLC